MKFHRIVFPISSAVIVLFVLLGAFFSEPLGQFLASLQDFIISTSGWFYIGAVAFFLIFVVWLFFSRFGSIRLGKDDDTPSYSYWTWFAMLFSAGMGIGLMFFAVAEPMTHFADPPRGEAAKTIEAARQAMTITFFHWGLHAWAIYIIIGLSLAYFSFRHDLPLSIRSALYPLIGERIHGGLGNAVDIFAVFGTLFGLATSLGLGVMQVNAGLDFLGILSTSTGAQVGLIIVITLAATISVVTGLDKGIRRLSELNLILAGSLLVFVLAVGPTVFLLSSFIQNVGAYASNLVEMTFRTDAFIGLEWQKDWTMFYWAWWISWSPFVGMFIARVSRGRTIREFIGGVLLVPTSITFLWLTVFGNTALHLDLFQGGGIAEAVRESVPTAVYVMLDQLPLASISATLVTLVVVIFFVTSSDSGSLVIDIITSGGDPDPPVAQRVFWALTEGAVAAVLLVTGGLLALQTAAIATALPFALIILLICVALVRGLSAEPSLGRDASRSPIGAPRMKALAKETPPAVMDDAPIYSSDGGANWRARLEALIGKVSRARSEEPTKQAAFDRGREFLRETVIGAFEKLKVELAKHGREVSIDQGKNYAVMTTLLDGKEEFSYAMKVDVRQKMSFAFPEHGERENIALLERATAVVRGGSTRSRPLSKWTEEAIIDDFLRAYSRWMGW